MVTKADKYLVQCCGWFDFGCYTNAHPLGNANKLLKCHKSVQAIIAGITIWIDLNSSQSLQLGDTEVEGEKVILHYGNIISFIKHVIGSQPIGKFFSICNVTNFFDPRLVRTDQLQVLNT